MSPNQEDTVLPLVRNTNSGSFNDQTLLPPLNAKGFHVTGDVIDKRYTVISELGRGGMGVVYLVEDSLLGGKFAIKRLLPDLASRPELVEVFKREGANAMRFTSESARFVTMRHVGSDAHGLYLVMDYITDPTLRSVLNNSPDNRLELALAVQVMSEISQAISDLHDLRYVHRDLKPENIFISQSASQVRVRLVDFGLTKDDAEGTRTSLRGGGSSGYASPEQRKGLSTTVATDAYSFGVIAYELLTGELPTGGDRISDFVDVPIEFEEWIMACLTSKPERRMELLESIDARMNGASTDASDKITEPVSMSGGKDDSQSSIVARPIQEQAKPAASTTSPTKPVTGRPKAASKATVGAQGKKSQDGTSAVTTARQTTTGSQDIRTKSKTAAEQASTSASKPGTSNVTAPSLPAPPPPKRKTTPSPAKKTTKTTITDNVITVNGQLISGGYQNASRGASSSVSIGSAGQSVSVSSGTNGRQISINNGQVRVGDISIKNGQVRVGDLVVTGGVIDMNNIVRHEDDYDDDYDDDDEDYDDEDDDYYDDDDYDDEDDDY